MASFHSTTGHKKCWKNSMMLVLLSCMSFCSMIIPVVETFSTTAVSVSVSVSVGRGAYCQRCRRENTAIRRFQSSEEQQSQQSQQSQQQQTIYLDPVLTDDRVTSLFAWISLAFDGVAGYDNLMLAMVAIFGANVPEQSEPKSMAKYALEQMANKSSSYSSQSQQPQIEDSNVLMGAPLSQYEREENSLGAMGAGQWLGQWKTRPHSLLSITDFADADGWVKTLPRGCRRTLKKADAMNFTVTALPIVGSMPAPHSSLAHFQCVMEHELRLIAGVTDNTDNDDDDDNKQQDANAFINALLEAINRYVGTTRMTGTIREYRDANTNKVIAFAHEVQKGRVIRGQWFYATNDASKQYVWFHSVQDLVKRAIQNTDIDVVDLGPSGTDAFTQLKEKYGFISVDDWTEQADYLGPFYRHGGTSEEDDKQSGLSNALKQWLGILGED